MYHIYHIEGVKVGCSVNPDSRVKRQGYKNYTILESTDCIEIASEREIFWQNHFGYKKDNVPYHKTIQSPTPEGMKKAGEAFKKYWNELSQNNPEQYNKRIKIFLSAGGRVRGKIQGERNKQSGLISNLGKIMSEKNNQQRVCPYCGLESRGVGYTRWHGENCSKKSN